MYSSKLSAAVLLVTLLTNPALLSRADDDQNVEDQGQPPESIGRIIGGEDAKDGTWPFMVSMQLRNQHICGGSILNDDTILTAAHCVKGAPGPDRIYIGHISIARLDKTYLYRVKRTIAHPKFSPRRIQSGFDVAVIKLARKIDFKDKKVKKICLPMDGDDGPVVDDCIVMGWGYTKPGANLPSRLKYVTVPILKDSICRGWPYNKDTILCAGYVKGDGKDACQGDSGGPLVCPSASNPKQWLQYGIVSYGDGCAKTFGFYTRVSALVSWIKQQAEGAGGGGGDDDKEEEEDDDEDDEDEDDDE